MRKLLSIILLLFVCVSNAQVVVKDTIKVNGDLLLGLNASGGNIPSYSGNLKSNFILKNSIWELALSPSYLIAYTPVNGEATLTKREFYTTISGSRFLTKGWKIVQFSEIENSLAQKMDLRWNVGVGPSYKIESGKFNCSIDYLSKFSYFLNFKIDISEK